MGDGLVNVLLGVAWSETFRVPCGTPGTRGEGEENSRINVGSIGKTPHLAGLATSATQILYLPPPCASIDYWGAEYSYHTRVTPPPVVEEESQCSPLPEPGRRLPVPHRVASRQSRSTEWPRTISNAGHRGRPARPFRRPAGQGSMPGSTRRAELGAPPSPGPARAPPVPSWRTKYQISRWQTRSESEGTGRSGLICVGQENRRTTMKLASTNELEENGKEVCVSVERT